MKVRRSHGSPAPAVATAPGPVVHLYTVCWDEADMLGFFFRHYDPWVSRYVIYDDGSTDGSREILARHPNVELRTLDRTDPDSFVLSHRTMQNHAWKESRGKADWVVITAIDEHLHVAGREMADYLAEQTRAGVTMIPAMGFDMNAPALPPDRGLLTEAVTRGRPRIGFNKLSLFRPDAIAEANFGPGRHAAEPDGKVVLPERDELMLWHFKHLGFSRNASREAAQALRLGRRDVAEGYGQHYLWSRARLRAFWDEMEAQSRTLAGPGFEPATTCVGPLWWRKEAAPAAPQPPTVSVLIKAYNHAPYVAQCVRSVLGQTFTDFEILATDDGSTDATLAVLRSFEDPRLDVLALPSNRGIPAAMNATVARARGRYLAILNSDDFAMPDRLARQVAFLDGHPEVDAVFSIPETVDEHGRPAAPFNDFAAALRLPDFSRRSWLRQFFFHGNCLCSPTAMIRRSAFERAGPYDLRLANLQDLDMWIRMLVAGCRFHVLPEPVTAFRIRDGAANASAVTQTSILRTEFELTQILERYAALDRTVFDEVFGADAPASLPQDAPILARLGALALTVERPSYRAFGLRCLHAAAANPDDIARLWSLTSTLDLFGECTLAERDNRIARHEADLARRDARIAELEGLSVPAADPESEEADPEAPAETTAPAPQGERIAPGQPSASRPWQIPGLPRITRSAVGTGSRTPAAGWTHRAAHRMPGLRARRERTLVGRLLDPVWYRASRPDLAGIADPVGHYLERGAAEGLAPHPLFDPGWYARSGWGGEGNPVLHYMDEGDEGGLSPHPLFDVAWYRARNADVAVAGCNALIHYLEYGAGEGRDPHPLFDTRGYCARNDLGGETNPLLHYLAGKGTGPHPLFDEVHYRAAIPDLDALGWTPLAHYVARGAAAGFDPNPWFSSAWYVANHETLGQTGENPLAHYVKEGAGQGYAPHPDFDPDWYRAHNPDVVQAGKDPLVHFIEAGCREGRAPHRPDVRSAEAPILAIPFEIRRAPGSLAGRDACAFVAYAPGGRIAPPTLAYLKALREAGVATVLVIATEGLTQPLPDLDDVAEGLILRANHGYDFAAWATALTAIPDLWQARRLILANDSLFGPTDSGAFGGMIGRIRASAADVIALTDSHQGVHHLMSYFIVLQGAALAAPAVRRFWNGVRSHADKDAVIAAYELRHVDWVAQAGLTYAVLFATDRRAPRATNPTLEEWRRLAAAGFPFLKAQLVRDRLAQCDPAGWRDAFARNPALLRTIEAELALPGSRRPHGRRPVPPPRQVDIRRPQLSTFYGAVQSTRPSAATDLALEVPFAAPPDPSRLPDRVAVLAHIHYPDLCAEIRSSLSHIPVRADLFISTDTPEKRAVIEAAFSGHAGGSVTVAVFPNVGRDWAPMLVGFAQVFDAYEVFLHLHSKKSAHDGRFAPWRDHLSRNLLGSREIVASILALLAEPDVGIVFAQHFGPVRNLLNWGGNYDTARALLHRCGARLGKDMLLDFPSGSFFWGRSAALRPLLSLGLTAEDFPAEAGQIDGTLAHALERIVLFAAERAGYRWAKVGRADSVDPATLVPVFAPDALAGDLDRVTRSLLHNRLVPRAEAALIPECTAIRQRPDRSARPRLNLVIPTLDPDQIFGGVATALRVYLTLADALGPEWDLRILCQSKAVDLRTMAAFPGYVLVQPGAPDGFARTLVDLTETEGGEIGLRRHDVFLATAWWTASAAFRLQSIQQDRHGSARPVIYLIQDHEPDFYGWSDRHALAQETYTHKDRTIAIINSEELAAFLGRRYALPDASVLRFALNPAISRGLTPQVRERIILIYGRPGTPRNAFPALCTALSRWQQGDPMSARVWRIVSVGEDFPPEKAGALANLTVAGKLPLDAYADLLSRASIGVSLMLSPHPSYPPLEMAAAGLVTVTNAYEAKDLSRRSPAIVSVPHATPEALADAIAAAVVRAETESVGRIVGRQPLRSLRASLPAFDAERLAERLRAMVRPA